MKKIKCVDFFCGGGGISIGMTQAGVRVIGALDNDPDCQATYMANHPNTPFIADDITKVRSDVLKRKFGIRQNDNNLLFVGCAPCQYWSIITGRKHTSRKQNSHASRNLLITFLRFVKYFKPGFVLVENVSGIVNNGKESGLEHLVKFLKTNNYTISAKVLHASHYGVPQTRQRFVLIASRVKKDIHLPAEDKKKSVVRDYIEDLPPIKAGDVPANDDPLHRSPALMKISIDRLKITPSGGLREHWAHRDDLMIPAYKNKPKSFFRENYGRMAWDEPGPTITTKFFNIGCGRFAHPEQIRAISLREGALLQTFPDDHRFKTSGYKATAKLIGNAFPPELARRIGEALQK